MAASPGGSTPSLAANVAIQSRASMHHLQCAVPGASFELRRHERQSSSANASPVVTRALPEHVFVTQWPGS